MDAADSVVHAYGLVPTGGVLTVPDGIDGSQVTTVTIGSLTVLVSELSARAYGADVWRANAEDPRWLEHIVQEHHRVLQAVVEETDVLPLRLPAIHDDTLSLENAVREQQQLLEAALERLRGHVELGAKAFLVEQRPTVTTDPPPTRGRDYLARRSAEADDRAQARTRRQAEVEDVHRALAGLSTDCAVSRPQDPALSGRREPMLLNAAYLVRRADLDRFVALAEQLHERLAHGGMSLEITGPWPPYNFADAADGSMTEPVR